MLLEKILSNLKNLSDPVNTEINGIRFRGEEQGRFRFKYNNYQTYAGDCLINETPVSKILGQAITYANLRTELRRYDEKTGEIYPYQGFPLVMAIDTSEYLLKPGLEFREEVISGEIDKKDIIVLFDDKVDYLKDIIHPAWHEALVFQQKQARKVDKIRKEIKTLKKLIAR